MNRLYYKLFAVNSLEKAYVRGKRLEAVFGLALFVLMAIGCTLVYNSNLLDGGGVSGDGGGGEIGHYHIDSISVDGDFSVDCVIFYLCVGLNILSAIYLLRNSLGYLSRVDYSSVVVEITENVNNTLSKRFECWLGILLYIVNFFVIYIMLDNSDHNLYLVGWFTVAAVYLMKNNIMCLFQVVPENIYVVKSNSESGNDSFYLSGVESEKYVRSEIHKFYENELRRNLSKLTGDSYSDGIMIQNVLGFTFQQLKTRESRLKNICMFYSHDYEKILQEEYLRFYYMCFVSPINN